LAIYYGRPNREHGVGVCQNPVKEKERPTQCGLKHLNWVINALCIRDKRYKRYKLLGLMKTM